MSALLLFQLLAATLPFAGNGNVVYDTFQSGKEGYSCYRIPVLCRLPNGEQRQTPPIHFFFLLTREH